MKEKRSQSDKLIQGGRIDATINRRVLILAAQKLFALRGVGIPLMDIAKEAGVTRMTFYRHFPDRQSVVIEVVYYNIELLEKYAEKIEARKDRFFKLIEFIMAQQLKFQSLVPFVPITETDIAVRLFNVFKVPVKESKAQGNLRPDFNLKKDLLLLISMLGGALVNPINMDRVARSKRALELMTKGLK
jgi:AcrR family transcriptional regulator